MKKTDSGQKEETKLKEEGNAAATRKRRRKMNEEKMRDGDVVERTRPLRLAGGGM
jgi:hypothetical protein